VKVRREKRIGHKEWWNRSCTKKKRYLRRQYGRWIRGRIRKEVYMEEKKKLKEYLEKRREKWRREEEETMRSLKNGAVVEIYK